MPTLTDIFKSGSINAIDTTLSGVLTPEQAHGFIDVIKDHSDILREVNTVKMTKLKKEVDCFDIANEILVRVPSGQAPSDTQRQKFGVQGATLNANGVQLFARILQDALEENAHNPNFEAETFKVFATAFSNDLARLGFKGESDDYAGSEFKALHKGWLKIAKDSDETTKITYDVDDTITQRLSALVASIDEDAIANSVIFINSGDYYKYQIEVAGLNAAGYAVNGGANKILGVPLKPTPLMPAGEYFASPLKNLLFGIGLDIRRNRWYDMEERALKYVFDAYVDYEIAVKRWCSYLSAA